MTKIYANFVISPAGLDACSTIDLTKYSYKLQFCEANG